MEVQIKEEDGCACGKMEDVYEREPAADEKAVLKDIGELEETDKIRFCGSCHGCLHPQIGAHERLHDMEADE
jgi:hypothetical protein